MRDDDFESHLSIPLNCDVVSQNVQLFPNGTSRMIVNISITELFNLFSKFLYVIVVDVVVLNFP